MTLVRDNRGTPDYMLRRELSKIDHFELDWQSK
jgi:hypothetical protein